ncbi:hypothetical protein GOP47_0022422 [Adiantum capillus-veneris]|uniref:Uncharacterized protein n=1 Tax=Adiantum capillus-veneris TaxID=13818 RepID=A0A9D4Z488_ADICA|nr:hypothetical protein GOP47_0022422 [Adiantum capillus-veneris]
MLHLLMASHQVRAHHIQYETSKLVADMVPRCDYPRYGSGHGSPLRCSQVSSKEPINKGIGQVTSGKPWWSIDMLTKPVAHLAMCNAVLQSWIVDRNGQFQDNGQEP